MDTLAAVALPLFTRIFFVVLEQIWRSESDEPSWQAWQADQAACWASCTTEDMCMSKLAEHKSNHGILFTTSTQPDEVQKALAVESHLPRREKNFQFQKPREFVAMESSLSPPTQKLKIASRFANINGARDHVLQHCNHMERKVASCCLVCPVTIGQSSPHTRFAGSVSCSRLRQGSSGCSRLGSTGLLLTEKTRTDKRGAQETSGLGANACICIALFTNYP